MLERDALTFGAVVPARLALDGLSRAQRRVAEDVAYVLGVYAVLDGPDDPQPYSRRFGAARLGVSDKTVARALRELVARGVLTACGETEQRQGWEHGTKLYAVGQAQPLAIQVEHATVEPVAIEDEQRAVRLAQVAPAVAGHAGTVALGDGAEDRQLGVAVHDRDATADLGAQCAIFDWEG